MKVQPALLLDEVIAIAKATGEIILNRYDEDHEPHLRTKPDGSPVTLVDLEADAFIEKELNQLSWVFPIVSEEKTIEPFSIRKTWPYFWCVDPLDGTRGFLKKTDDFVVSIALVHQHRSVLGVIYVPLEETVYYAATHEGAYKQEKNKAPVKIHTSAFQEKVLRIALSRTAHSDRVKELLKQWAVTEVINMGSAIKSCFVAEGRIDLYPRWGPTGEWDTAAAQCIVEEAGGGLIDFQGHPLTYNTKESLENPSFLVVGDVQHDWLTYFRR